MKKKYFKYNLKFLRKKNKLTQKQLASILEVNQSSISEWEKGLKEPATFGVVKIIADLFNVTVDDLFFTDLSLATTNTVKNEDACQHHKVPVLGKIAAGLPIEAIEDFVDEICLPYPTKGEVFALQISGDSMDKIIPDGYYAVLRKQEYAENGQIVAVLVNGCDATLKKIYIFPNSIVLIPCSSNEKHKEQMYSSDAGDEIQILGKYLYCVSPSWDDIE
ncbi:S24 family peptidase [Bacillus sp. FDAARGOS_1420]|uniref:S24 family peptidase n=1 Tax=unclassified Bacillus (in: firmicutes) TaxID=185979 RepID=UPI001C5AEC21|nr:S24 family peptidase [Bacillus sp. FDAARGOS_1420]MBW3493219.1 helix-turn-helix domain-containing protein [Bacillus sp. FDAARGOS_1420]